MDFPGSPVWLLDFELGLNHAQKGLAWIRINIFESQPNVEMTWFSNYNLWVAALHMALVGIAVVSCFQDMP